MWDQVTNRGHWTGEQRGSLSFSMPSLEPELHNRIREGLVPGPSLVRMPAGCLRLPR
jgi:hypothetical protein